MNETTIRTDCICEERANDERWSHWECPEHNLVFKPNEIALKEIKRVLAAKNKENKND